MEMLGVLSIIGVLSISAMLGYNYAITKYKSNTTINDLNRFVVVVTQQMLMGHDTLDLSEANNKTTLNYPATAYYLEDARYFEIALANVPPKVCQQILRENLKEPLVIKVNDYAYVGDDSICKVDDEGSPVEMVFQYVSDLDSDELPYGTCKVDADCPGNCVTCNPEGLCVSTCVAGERCSTDMDTGEMLCCPADRRAGPYCCATSVNGWCCDDNAQNCCPWHKPLRDKNGICYACDNAGGVDVTGVTENCNVCTNREVINKNQCVIKCPDDMPVRDYYNVCRACDDPEPLDFYHLSAADCFKNCPQRVRNGSNDRVCSYDLCGHGIFKDKPLTDSNGRCYSCGETSNISVGGVTHEGCEVCPNRYLSPDGQYCILNCPSGEFRDGSGICRSCEDTNPFYFGGNSSMALNCITQCPNRVRNGYKDNACAYSLCGHGIFEDKPLTNVEGRCFSCDDGQPVYVLQVTHEGCEMCENRRIVDEKCILDCPEGEFRNSQGQCISCFDEKPAYNLFVEECLRRCPNRVANGYQNGACSYELCGQGIFKEKPLTAFDGICYTCDEKNNVAVMGVSHEGCNQCPDTRNLYNDYCVPKCPAETPLRGRDNKCYACDTPERVKVDGMVDVCLECPNERILDGNYCVLK